MRTAARRLAAPRASRGFTLIELSVGIGISLVILAALVSTYVTTAGIGRSNLRVADLQSNGQQALDALRRDVINAGNHGVTGATDQISATGVTVSNDCASGFATNLRQAVWGADDSNPFSGTCIPAANYLRGDVLAIRRLGIAPTGTLQTSRLYLRSAYQVGEYFVGATPPSSFYFTPWSDYAADAAVYFVSPFTASATESPKVPALYRIRLGAGPAMGAPELVAAGIEDLQVQYEVRDAASGSVRVYDAGTAPIADASTANYANGWDRVVAVRVSLLVRAGSGDVGFAPGVRSYTLGNRQLSFNDNVPRQVMSSVFSLRNR